MYVVLHFVLYMYRYVGWLCVCIFDMCMYKSRGCLCVGVCVCLYVQHECELQTNACESQQSRDCDGAPFSARLSSGKTNPQRAISRKQLTEAGRQSQTAGWRSHTAVVALSTIRATAAAAAARAAAAAAAVEQTTTTEATRTTTTLAAAATTTDPTQTHTHTCMYKHITDSERRSRVPPLLERAYLARVVFLGARVCMFVCVSVVGERVLGWVIIFTRICPRR